MLFRSTVGAGAKLLGGIVVGDGSTIGANSVVLHSVAPRVMAAGAPARVVRSLLDDSGASA